MRIGMMVGSAGFLVALLIASIAAAQPFRPPDLPAPSTQPEAIPPGQAGAGDQAGGNEPGYLGLIADDKQEHNAGARLKEVIPDGPAAQAGLQQDDLLTSVNGKPIHSLDDMASVLQQLPAGAKVTFEIQRDGKSQTAVVTLGKRPSADQRKFQNFGRQPGGQGDQSMPDQPLEQPSIDQPPLGSTMDSRSPSAARLYGPSPSGVAPPPLLGIRTNNVTDQDRARLGLSSTAGAHVIARTRGSAAEKANIPLDAIIVSVNGQAVGSPNDLSALLAQAGAGSTIELTYLYNRQPTTARVTLGAMPTGSQMPPANSWPPASGGDPDSLSRDLARPQYRGMPMNPGRATTSPPMPGDQAQPAGDAERIEMLERRVRELEQRVKELEDKLQRQA